MGKARSGWSPVLSAACISVETISGVVREPGHLLSSPALLHPSHLRPRLLRLTDRVAVVEPVHPPALARQHGHPGGHLHHGEGGAAEADEEEHN